MKPGGGSGSGSSRGGVGREGRTESVVVKEWTAATLAQAQSDECVYTAWDVPWMVRRRWWWWWRNEDVGGRGD